MQQSTLAFVAIRSSTAVGRGDGRRVFIGDAVDSLEAGVDRRVTRARHFVCDPEVDDSGSELDNKARSNGLCPCGSGRKYKRCCLDARTPSPRLLQEVTQRLAAREFAEAHRKATYGDIRPVISAKFHDHRFVAVGSTLHYSPTWSTFVDFVIDYLKHSFGSGWGQAELAKPTEQRHEVMRWYEHFCRHQAEGVAHPNGLSSIPKDGTVAALLNLAYDLYVLKDQGKLQKQVLQRLRRPDHFRGARYELFVAATFIRCGFDIAYEDETDGAAPHPEFSAVDRATGQTFDVEAKAKHRLLRGALESTDPPIPPRIKGLLRDAARKARTSPFIVFLELAMPPEDIEARPSWIKPVQTELAEVVAEHGSASPFDLVMFTNVPHHYGKPGEKDPNRHFYAAWPPLSRVPETIIDRLGAALLQYGEVPMDFQADSDPSDV